MIRPWACENRRKFVFTIVDNLSIICQNTRFQSASRHLHLLLTLLKRCLSSKKAKLSKRSFLIKNLKVKNFAYLDDKYSYIHTLVNSTI